MNRSIILKSGLLHIIDANEIISKQNVYEKSHHSPGVDVWSGQNGPFYAK